MRPIIKPARRAGGRRAKADPRLARMRILIAWAAVIVIPMLTPNVPTSMAGEVEVRDIDLRESVGSECREGNKNGAAPRKRLDPARVERLQPALLKTAIDRLAPQVKGATDIYAIGLAGWSDQDVFIKELDGALASLAQVMPIKDRTVRLVNHPQTLETAPLATRQNFAAAVRAIARVMDKQEDVLLLMSTSHGTPNGLALQFPGGALSELTAQEVETIFAYEGIKNRVVIVSSCYSGVFVRALANEHTIVLTAADERSVSFGCATQREWTYFGDALFNQSLRPGTDLRRAFNGARTLIHGWELMDRARSSNPQAHFGQALVDKLDPVFAAMGAGR